MSVVGYILAGLAAVAAGLINALAGGGTLITFPVLMVSIPSRSQSSPSIVTSAKLGIRRLGPNEQMVSYSGPLRLAPSSSRTTRPQAITHA